MTRSTPAIWTAVGLLALLFSPAAGRADGPVPLGPPFPVAGVDFQVGTAAAMDQHGRFLVVYYEFFGGYQARGFEPDGTPAGSFPFVLEPYSPSWSSDAYDAATFGPDDFVVARENNGEEIWARRYRVDGTPIGPLLVVDALPADGFATLVYPAVAPWKTESAFNSFVVAWVEDLGAGDPDGTDIFLRSMALDGGGGPRFPVNTFVDGDQTAPEVARGPDGTLAVVWMSQGSPGEDSDGTSIQARYFFPPSGAPGPQFQVNVVADGDQRRPDVAIGTDGRALVVWQSPDQPGASTDSIRGRLLAADGTPDGAELRIGPGAADGERAARVIPLPDGQFQVAWNRNGRTVMTQMVGSDGGLVGPALVVSDSSYRLFFGFPALASRASGDFVVSWPPFGTEPGTVYARRYYLPLFEDGFESGDTSAWTTTTP